MTVTLRGTGIVGRMLTTVAGEWPAHPRDDDQRFQIVAEQINEGLIQIDRRGRIQLANRRFCAIVQYEPHEIIGKNLFELLQPTAPGEFALPERFETRLIRRSGRDVWVSVSTSPLPGVTAEGPVGYLALLADISTQKRQENRTQMQLAISRILGSDGDTRSRLGDVLSIIRSSLSFRTAAVWLHGEESGTCELVGFDTSPDAFDGGNEDFASVSPLGEQAMAEQQPMWIEEVNPHRTSVAIPLIGSNGPLGAIQILSEFKRARDEETLMLLAEIAKRISESLERQDAEERLRKKEAQLEQAQEIAQLGSWIWNVNTDRAQWSAQLVRIVEGEDRDGGELPDTFQAYVERIDPEDRERIVRLLDHAFVTHEPFQFDHVLLRPDGSRRDIHLRGEVIVDEDGTVRFAGTSQDITDRKILEMDAERGRRIDSLGAVAATIAHEFRNVLMSILPFGEALARCPDEAVRKASGHILQAVQRGRTITEEIVRYTRPVEPAFETIALGQWLEAMAVELRGHVPKAVVLQIDCPSETLFIRGDAQQLGQVLVNLVINAKDAMPAGGNIRIIVRRCFSGDKLHFGALPTLDRYAHVEVRDSGTGMDADTLRRVFEPMFTTKRHGTGLGLAVVYQLVTRSGGHVSVESAPGVGTVFHLLLPMTWPEAVVQEQSASASVHPER